MSTKELELILWQGEEKSGWPDVILYSLTGSTQYEQIIFGQKGDIA